MVRRPPSTKDAVWNHSVFSENRDKLIEHDAATELFSATVEKERLRRPLLGVHISVGGTLIQGWASRKSVRRKDGSDDDRLPGNWHDEPRSNERHASRTNPRQICTGGGMLQRRCPATSATAPCSRLRG
jgi:hypothetical protein